MNTAAPCLEISGNAAECAADEIYRNQIRILELRNTDMSDKQYEKAEAMYRRSVKLARTYNVEEWVIYDFVVFLCAYGSLKSAWKMYNWSIRYGRWKEGENGNSC